MIDLSGSQMRGTLGPIQTIQTQVRTPWLPYSLGTVPLGYHHRGLPRPDPGTHPLVTAPLSYDHLPWAVPPAP